MVIEIFCGNTRVTACLKQFGLASCFGVDYIGSKQAASPVMLADLCDLQGITLLHQWLAHEYVVGIFLAPPCGWAPRARQIPLPKGRRGVRSGPCPLWDDDHPNGRPHLTMQERRRVSRANQLYHLTAELAEWAITEGCFFCRTPTITAFFGQQLFGHRWLQKMFTIFHSCQYGNATYSNTRTITVPVHQPGRSSRAIQMGPYTPLGSPEVDKPC